MCQIKKNTCQIPVFYSSVFSCQLNTSDASNESSQDTESYEVIGKSDKEQSADEASPIVESVGPNIQHQLKDLEAVDDEEEDYEADDNDGETMCRSRGGRGRGGGAGGLEHPHLLENHSDRVP